jgi:hypothetical protein
LSAEAKSACARSGVSISAAASMVFFMKCSPAGSGWLSLDCF